MNYILFIFDFVGRLHPLLVHLPIGILLLAVLFTFLSKSNNAYNFDKAIEYALLTGAIAALFSCITGYLLSLSGDYESHLISYHQYVGIVTMLLAFAAYVLVKKGKVKFIKWVMLLMAVLITITGHLGGTLTHGVGYLTAGFKSNQKGTLIKPIPNIQQAQVYTDVVQPILESNCYNCHASSKQKGKLRLDEPAFILKGGEDGKAIVPGKLQESELINRISLPLNHDDHMPPASKPQLTTVQSDILKWWVEQGAPFDKKIQLLSQPEKIKQHLLALQNGKPSGVTPVETYMPSDGIEPVAGAVIQELHNRNIAVTTVSQSSNYLTASFAAIDSITDQDMALLKKISRQLIWLKMGNTTISQQQAAMLGELTSLTRLSIENTNLTDEKLLQLNSLTQLKYLNISNTKVTENGILKLSGLKKLNQLFIYGIPVSINNYSNIKKMFPVTTVDTGGYKLSFLSTDTMLVKAKINK